MIQFINAKRTLGRTLCSMLDPEEFLQDMIAHGLLERTTGDYGKDVYDLCRNGATWVAGRLQMFGDDIKVIDGRWDTVSHCWVKLNDLNIDITLAQVVGHAPKLAVSDATRWNQWPYYSEDNVFSIEEWVERALAYG